MTNTATKATETTTRTCAIAERGNGFPDVGDYVSGDDGEVYEVVSMDSTIHTGGAGGGNYVHARVVLADWSDVDDDNEPVCTATLDDEDDIVE
jgi:hypothetical protein